MRGLRDIVEVHLIDMNTTATNKAGLKRSPSFPVQSTDEVCLTVLPKPCAGLDFLACTGFGRDLWRWPCKHIDTQLKTDRPRWTSNPKRPGGTSGVPGCERGAKGDPKGRQILIYESAAVGPSLGSLNANVSKPGKCEDVIERCLADPGS